MMQVACTHCGTQYQFDASAIPQEGYDAQCTHCGQIFFVGNQSQASSPNDLITVECTSCGAVYQFSRSAVPPEGYDAQCSQCQKVFFVGLPGPVAVATEPSTADVAPQNSIGAADSPAPEPDLLSGVPIPVPEIPELAAPVDPPAETTFPVVEKPIEDGDVLDDLEPLPVSNEVVALPTPLPVEPTPQVATNVSEPMGVPTEEAAHPPPNLKGDPTALDEDELDVGTTKKSKRLALGIAGSGVLLAALAGVYFFKPHWLVGGSVQEGLTSDVDEQSLQTARNLIFEDHQTAYNEAAQILDTILATHPKNLDVVVLRSLSSIFVGADAQKQALSVVESGNKALSLMKSLEQATAKKRTPEQQKRIEDMQKNIAVLSEESSRLFEAAKQQFDQGFSRLQEHVKDGSTHADLLAVVGIYYSLDKEGPNKAKAFLRQALDISVGKDQALDSAKLPSIWIGYLQAAIDAYDKNTVNQAISGLTACVRKESGFQRARWDLVQLYHQQGKKDEAKKLASEILQAVPKHEKAKKYLEEVSRQGTPPSNDKVSTAKPAKVDRNAAARAKKKKKKR